MSHAMRFAISMILAALFTLTGCGVEPSEDDNPTIGSIQHWDFPCPEGGVFGPVIVEAVWPVTPLVLKITQGSSLAQLNVFNQGQNPSLLTGSFTVILEGVTLNPLGYILLSHDKNETKDLGRVTYSGRPEITFPKLEDANAIIPPGGKLSVHVNLAPGSNPASGDIWKVSVLPGALHYRTISSCGEGKEKVEGVSQGAALLSWVLNP